MIISNVKDFRPDFHEFLLSLTQNSDSLRTSRPWHPFSFCKRTSTHAPKRVFCNRSSLYLHNRNCISTSDHVSHHSSCHELSQSRTTISSWTSKWLFDRAQLGCAAWFWNESARSNIGALSPVHRKEQKKVSKLEAQIPYFSARKQQEEVDKIQNQIDAIWEKARSSRGF